MMSYWGNPYFGRNWNFWPGGLIELGVSILFWLAIVFLIVTLVRGWKRHERSSDFAENPDKALNILKERYAKGEIDKKEFEEMKKTIE